MGREAMGMGRQGFVEKKRIFCYFSVNSTFLEAVVVLVVLPHYQFFSTSHCLIFQLGCFLVLSNYD